MVQPTNNDQKHLGLRKKKKNRKIVIQLTKSVKSNEHLIFPQMNTDLILLPTLLNFKCVSYVFACARSAMRMSVIVSHRYYTTSANEFIDQHGWFLTASLPFFSIGKSVIGDWHSQICSWSIWIMHQTINVSFLLLVFMIVLFIRIDTRLKYLTILCYKLSKFSWFVERIFV